MLCLSRAMAEAAVTPNQIMQYSQKERLQKEAKGAKTPMPSPNVRRCALRRGFRFEGSAYHSDTGGIRGEGFYSS